jgi:hypothetical protein
MSFSNEEVLAAIGDGLNPIFEVTLGSPSLTLAPLSINVGFYAVKLVAELSDTDPKLRSSSILRFRVKPSPPVAVIDGQGVDFSKVIGAGSTLSLSSGESYVLGSSSQAGGYAIMWNCRPFFPSCSSESVRRGASDCFLNDESHQYFLERSSSPILSIPSAMLRPELSAFEFQLTLLPSDPSINLQQCKSCNRSVIVRISSDADVLEVQAVRAVSGDRNVGDFINPALSALLTVQCEACSANTTYQWVDTFDLDPCTDFVLGKAAAVRYSLQDNAQSVTNRKDLALKPNTIKGHIRLRVYVTDLSTSRRGYADIDISPNLAPIGGSCNFRLPAGVEMPVALFTPVTLLCNEWRDEDDPDGALYYSFAYVLPGEKSETFLGDGIINSIQRSLPAGYGIELRFRIRDAFGSFAEVVIPITVATNTDVSDENMGQLAASRLFQLAQGGDRDEILFRLSLWQHAEHLHANLLGDAT